MTSGMATDVVVADLAHHSWENDEDGLEVYFRACTENFKNFSGQVPDKIKLKIYGVYKQATQGDNREEKPADDKQRAKWEEWLKFKGTTPSVAKRRYITLLRSIDPKLIHVEVKEDPPPGFPETAAGEPICARCNSHAGCDMELWDEEGLPITETLNNDESLLSYDTMIAYVRRVNLHLRCEFGRHVPVTPKEAKPFMKWFHHVGNGGFTPYNPEKDSTMPKMLDVVLSRQFKHLHMMQLAKDQYTYEEMLFQRERCDGLARAYKEISGGHEYQYLVPCTRDTTHCNNRRRFNAGRNHTHPLDLELPHVNYELYRPVNLLRKEVTRLGLDPHTGNLPEVQDVADRELVLGVRIAEHQRKKFVVAEAVRSQRARKYWHPKEQSMMLDWQSNNTRKQLENAIAENKRELTVTLIKRGAPADVETPGGLTAVIRSTVSTDKACLKKLVEHGADINYFNKKHGMSALCFAARRDDLIMMHALLDNGAYAGLEGPTGLCPLNVAAFYGHKEPVNVLTEFVVRNGISGGLESERILNYQNKDGDTALHIAARRRNTAVCRHLLKEGCDPNLKNHRKMTAAMAAKEAGWTDLGDWLRETRAFGPNAIESFTDKQMDRRARLDSGKLATALKTGELALVNDAMKIKTGASQVFDGDDLEDDDAKSDSSDNSRTSFRSSNSRGGSRGASRGSLHSRGGSRGGSRPSSTDSNPRRSTSRKSRKLTPKEQQRREVKMREQEAERNRNKVSVAAAAAVKAKEAVEISVQMKHEAGAAADKAKHFKDPAFLQPADKILEADNEAAAAFDRFTKFTTTEMNAKLLHADSLVTDMNQADMNTVQGAFLRGLTLVQSANEHPQIDDVVPLSLELVRAGHASPNFETDQGTTPLLSASYSGQTYAIRCLLREGCDPNYINMNGRTALMAAAAGGHVLSAVELIRAGANIEAMDLEGRTAGGYADEAGHRPMADLLVRTMTAGLDHAMMSFAPPPVLDQNHENLMTKAGATPGKVEDAVADMHSWKWRLPKRQKQGRPHHLTSTIDGSSTNMITGSISGELQPRGHELVHIGSLNEPSATTDPDSRGDSRGVPAEERPDPLESHEGLSLVTRTATAESMGSMMDTPHHHNGAGDDYSIGLDGSDDISVISDANGPGLDLNQRSTGSWGVRDRKRRSDGGEKRLNSFTSGPPSVRGGSVRLAELEENDKEMAKLMEETRKIQQAEMQVQADPNTGKFHGESQGGSAGTPALEEGKGLKRTKNNLQETAISDTGDINPLDPLAALSPMSPGSVAGRPTAEPPTPDLNAIDTNEHGDETKRTKGKHPGFADGAGEEELDEGSVSTTATKESFNRRASAAASDAQLKSNIEAYGAKSHHSTGAASIANAAAVDFDHYSVSASSLHSHGSGTTGSQKVGMKRNGKRAGVVAIQDDEKHEELNVFANMKVYQKRAADLRKIKREEERVNAEEEAAKNGEKMANGSSGVALVVREGDDELPPPPKESALKVMDKLVPLQYRAVEDFNTDSTGLEATVPDPDRVKTKVELEREAQQIVLGHLGHGRRHTMKVHANDKHDSNSMFDFVDSASRPTTGEGSLATMALRAAAKQPLEEASTKTLNKVRKLGTIAAGDGTSGGTVGARQKATAMLEDGIGEWKQRLQNVSEQWVADSKQPVVQLAAKANPELYLRPAELDYASFLVSQRKYPQAEAMLKATLEMQLRSAPEKKVAQGWTHRSLGAMWEARGGLAKALEHREKALELMSKEMEPTHPENLIGLDLIAGTLMGQELWFAARELYAKASADLSGAYGEGRVELSRTLNQRAFGVDMARERFQFAIEDRASSAIEAKLRDPEGTQGEIEGKTTSHLAILLTEASTLSATARKTFKKHVRKASGDSSGFSDALAFWLAAEDFRHMIKGDPGFAHAVKRIYKTYVRPPAKLPMLTMGVRNDIVDAMETTNKDNAADATLYVAAQALAIRTVFSGVYLDWLDTADGFRWHATRRVESIEPRHIAAIRRFQRGWRKKLRERKEAAEAAEAQRLQDEEDEKWRIIEEKRAASEAAWEAKRVQWAKEAEAEREEEEHEAAVRREHNMVQMHVDESPTETRWAIKVSGLANRDAAGAIEELLEAHVSGLLDPEKYGPCTVGPATILDDQEEIERLERIEESMAELKGEAESEEDLSRPGTADLTSAAAIKKRIKADAKLKKKKKKQRKAKAEPSMVEFKITLGGLPVTAFKSMEEKAAELLQLHSDVRTDVAFKLGVVLDAVTVVKLETTEEEDDAAEAAAKLAANEEAAKEDKGGGAEKAPVEASAGAREVSASAELDERVPRTPTITEGKVGGGGIGGPQAEPGEFGDGDGGEGGVRLAGGGS